MIKIKYLRTDTTKLTPELYKQFYDLNLRKRGIMRYSLVDAKRNSLNFPIVYAKIDGIVAGWGIADHTQQLCCFYVRQRYRRKGIGRGIIRRMTKLVDNYRVISSLPIFAYYGFRK